MYTTRGCTPGVPTVYPYPQYPWLTQPEGRRVRVLTGTGTGQPGITQGLPVLIPSHKHLFHLQCQTQLQLSLNSTTPTTSHGVAIYKPGLCPKSSGCP